MDRVELEAVEGLGEAADRAADETAAGVEGPAAAVVGTTRLGAWLVAERRLVDVGAGLLVAAAVGAAATLVVGEETA